MIVGIMSDSHDHLPRIQRAVDEFKKAGAGAIIHAGDFIAPMTFDCLRGVNMPFFAVFGNNDGEQHFLRERYAPLGTICERYCKAEIGGLRFMITHGDDVIDSLARSGDYDVVVYGHTHKVDIRMVGPALVVNPGELCGWCSGKATAALLDTGTRDVTIIDIP